MSGFDLFPAEAAAKMESGAPVDLNASAGFFEGSLAAPMKGALKGLVVEPARVLNLGLSTVAGAVDKALGSSSRDWWFENMMLERASRRVTPNPREVGVAGQILHSLFDVGGQALTLGAPGVLTLKTAGKAIEGVEEGLDPETALRKGAIEGGSAALGVALPIAAPVMVGSRIPALVQQLGYGIAANVPLGIASRGLTHTVLADAGYKDMAEQYKALDESGLLTDFVLGTAFGGLGHAITERGARLPLIRPADIDAALAKRNAYHLEVNGAPGLARTGETRDAHVDAVLKATEDLIAGRPVDVTAELRAADFEPNKAIDEARALLVSETERVAQPILDAQAETQARESAAAAPIEPERVANVEAALKAEGVETSQANVELVHLIARAREIDPAAVDAIPEKATDSQYLTRVKEIIDAHDKAQAADQGRPGAGDEGPGAGRRDEPGAAGSARGEAARGATGEARTGGESAGEVEPWERDPLAVTEPLTLADPEIRTRIERMAEKEAGWAEIGGRLIRIAHSEVAGDETISRTKWIARSDWWQGRPGALNEDKVRAAVRKALAGQPLKKAEQRMVNYLVEVANQRLLEERHMGGDEFARLAEDMRAEGVEPAHATVVDADAVTRAVLIDEARVERAATKYENDDLGFMAEIRKIIDEAEAEKSSKTAPRGGEEGGRAPSAEEAARPDLALERQTEADLAAKAARAETGDTEERAAALRDRNEAILSAPEGTAPPRDAAAQKVPTQQAGLFGRDVYEHADAQIRGADEIVREVPDMLVPTEDGTLVPAHKVMADADEGIAKATADAKGYEAAVLCATRAGG